MLGLHTIQRKENKMSDNAEVKRKEENMLTMKKELADLKKKNRADEKAKIKRVKEQQQRIEMSKDTEVWIELTKAKQQMNRILKENKLTASYNLKSIAAIPDHFSYQHPSNEKLKGNSKEEEWVKSFLSNGGTEKQLMDKADAGRANVWKRIKFKRPKTAPAAKTKTANKPSKVGGGVS